MDRGNPNALCSGCNKIIPPSRIDTVRFPVNCRLPNKCPLQLCHTCEAGAGIAAAVENYNLRSARP